MLSFVAQSQEGQTTQCADIELTPEEVTQLPYFGLSETQLAAYSTQLQAYTDDASRGSSSCGSDNNYVYMPIFIYDHTIAKLTQTQIDELMSSTNEIFAKLGLKFKVFNSCRLIAPNSPFTAVYAFGANFQPQYPNATNAINLHIVETVLNSGGYYNITGNNIVIPISTIPTPSSTINNATLAHELGHFFGLWLHTHAYAPDAPGPGFSCYQEPVSRTKKFDLLQLLNPICLCVNNVSFLLGRRMCEVTGDCLCDTPADPCLRPSKLSNCTYIGTELDLFSVPYTPDTHNLMSYTNDACLTSSGPPTLSPSQKAVIAKTLFGKQDFIIDYNESDAVLPDRYEPDNVDLSTNQNELKIGESQCHTFHTTTTGFALVPVATMSCADEVDILILRRSQTVSTLTLSVTPDPCVGKVTIFNLLSNGMRGAIAQGIIQNGFDFTIPCTIANQSDFLVEIERKVGVGGEYNVSLSASNNMAITGDKYFCVNQTQPSELTIANLQQGATVNWSSFYFNITPNGDKCLVNTLLSNGSNPYVNATVYYNGCYQQFTYYFSVLDTDTPIKVSVEKTNIPCFPKDPVACFKVIDYNPKFTYNWTATIGAITQITADEICVDLGDTFDDNMAVRLEVISPCGNTVALKTFYITNKNCKGPITLVISPNPTIDVINIAIEDKTEQPGGYQIFITNSSGTILYSEDTTIKTFSLSAETYEAGIYHCHIIKGQEHVVESFTVGKM